MVETYKIGIEVALVGSIKQGLEAIAAKLLGINTKVKDIEGGFNRWAVAIGGAAAVFAGSALLSGMNKLADKGEELLHQQALMRTQGWSLKDMQDALNAAWKTSAEIMTTTPSENLKHLADVAYATGGMGSAISILPQLAKSNAILNSIKGGGTDEVFNLVKALEQKGLATPENRETFTSYIDAMTKVAESTHGRVTPRMFQSAFVYGRTAMLGWDESFITEILPRLIQSMSISGGGGGGNGRTGPGNALMSAFAKVVQGQMPKNAAETMAAFGLADQTHIKGSASSQTNVHGAALFGQDPYAWVQSYLVPALKAHGINMSDSVAVGQAIAKMFPVRTASSIIAEMALQGSAALGTEASPFEKDRRLKQQAQSINPSFAGLGENDPFTIWAKFTAQLKAFGEAMAPLAQMKLDWLKDLTPFARSLSQLAAANPGAVRLVGEALVGLAIGLTALGTVAVLTAAAMLVPGGAITVVLGTLGATMAALAAINWRAITNGLDSFVSAIRNLPAAIMAAIAGIPAAIGHLFGGAPAGPAPFAPPLPPHTPTPGQEWNKPMTLGQANTIHNKVAVYLDSRPISEAVSEQLAMISTFPRQAAFGDSYLGWNAPDNNISWG